MFYSDTLLTELTWQVLIKISLTSLLFYTNLLLELGDLNPYASVYWQHCQLGIITEKLDYVTCDHTPFTRGSTF